MMRIGFQRSSIALSLMALAGNGLRAPEPKSAADIRFANRTMQDYAQCVLGLNSKLRLDRFLAVNPFARGADRLGTTIAPSECLTFNGQMSFNASLYRAALYGALYRRDFAKKTVLPTIDQPALNIAGEVTSDDASQADLFVEERKFGDCASRLAPASVREVIMAETDSKAEIAAFAALGEPMGECLAPGQTLHFSRLMLRGILAEALYKLSAAAANPPGTGPTANPTTSAKPN